MCVPRSAVIELRVKTTSMINLRILWPHSLFPFILSTARLSNLVLSLTQVLLSLVHPWISDHREDRRVWPSNSSHLLKPPQIRQTPATAFKPPQTLDRHVTVFVLSANPTPFPLSSAVYWVEVLFVQGWTLLTPAGLLPCRDRGHQHSS